MKNFSLDLKKHATKKLCKERNDTTNKKKEEKNHYKQKVCHICKKGFSNNEGDKKYHKVKYHCYYTGKYIGAAHDICNLRYKTPKEIPIVSHNGSTYDYHFIIKELVEELE